MKIRHFCGNRNFRVTATQYTYRHAGKFLIVNDVQCTKCEYCDEAYFKANVLKRIEKEFNAIYYDLLNTLSACGGVIHYQGEKAKQKLYVPVERFVQIGELTA